MFPEILRYAQDDLNPYDAAAKRQLCLFALVCRFWASKTRDRIFNSLTLRSRQDALQFTAFAKCGIWPVHSILPIGKYVKLLVFEVDIHDLCWIHLILHCMPNDILGPTSDYRIGVRLKFKVPIPDEKKDSVLVPAPRHVYHDLPRRFPPTMTRFRSTEIEVRGLCFSKLDHLSSFAFSLNRHLLELRCDSVNVMDAHTLRNANPNRTAPQMGTYLRFVNVISFVDAMVFVEHMFSCRVCATSSQPLDYAQTRRNISSLLNGIPTLLKSFCGKTDITKNEGLRYLTVYFNKGEHDC